VQTTLVPQNWGKKSPAAKGSFKGKPKPKPNGNIQAFFKKAEEENNKIFYEDRSSKKTSGYFGNGVVTATRNDEHQDVVMQEDDEGRFNEIGGSVKKRKLSEDPFVQACTPPPPENGETIPPKASDTGSLQMKLVKRSGPFVDDSDSESEESEAPRRDSLSLLASATPKSIMSVESGEMAMDNQAAESKDPPMKEGPLLPKEETMTEASPLTRRGSIPEEIPLSRQETTTDIDRADFEEFEGLDDEDFPFGEEGDERKWMVEQMKLEMAEAGMDGEFAEMEAPELFGNETDPTDEATSSCPMCSTSLAGFSEQDVLVHVNACLDGNSTNTAKDTVPEKASPPTAGISSKMFKRPPRPAKPGQESPFQLGDSTAKSNSAFSKLMASHAEDSAWASAAASETAARGKPSYQRTCPFYKILPGFYICVDAFRYGAVKGQQAYFLSHFHSDHYVGLTASWAHGPIYCSRVTANLVRQQLRVDPKWVVDLEFEEKTEVPGTEGVHVTMIPANHCPGSSLFLFEKELGKGKAPRLQRVLHCGDFRACQAHIEHPLLRPEVLDAVSGKNRQQKLDVCYLDTTYLNPKYAFPPQAQVIQACADMCVSLNKTKVDDNDSWEQMKKQRAGKGMIKFVRKNTGPEADEGDQDTRKDSDKPKGRGRLLVVVGTYSIGKERICIGIAKALKSKIYAPPNKQRICHALEDVELNNLLTKDPREAQVHMTPLFEIRSDTLDDYLRDYRDTFSRAVAFRPSGWNYRPPNSRLIDNPSVSTVLHSQNWKTSYSMRDLVPQRGSTNTASCFGVPYSEHSSFRELTMFCCALRIDKIIPTVNVGNAKIREKMKAWCEKWAAEKKKNGLFRLEDDGGSW
jgi:DNA cross-link repair 1A protein